MIFVYSSWEPMESFRQRDVLSDSGKRMRKEWGGGEKSSTPDSEPGHCNYATPGQGAGGRCWWALGEGMTPLGWGLIRGLEADLRDLICWLTLLPGNGDKLGWERLPASSLADPEDGEEGRRAGRTRRLPLPSWAVSPGASAGNFQAELSLKTT